ARAPLRPPPPPRRPTGSAELLVHELDDAGHSLRRGGRAGIAIHEALGLALVQLELDLAACLAIAGHEAVEVGTWMGDVLGALDVEGRRRLHRLAALEREHRIALRHGGLARPVEI